MFMSPDEVGEYHVPPSCTADVEKRLRNFAESVVRACGVHRPCSVDAFVNYYTGRRRTLYANAAAELQHRPLTRRDFRVLNAFVKAEKINFTAKKDPAPRVIQPRSPRYNVEVGRFLRPLEHVVYRGIEKTFGAPTVMKGYNAEEVASIMRDHWNQFASPAAIGLDASRFDQHVRREMLTWEHGVYLNCFLGADREYLAWLLSGQLVNRGSMRCTDGTLKYEVDGSRMSGDMNTALGNCLIMCGLVHTLASERKVNVRLVNNGDDCVVFCESRDVQKLTNGLEAWFKEFGFKMKVEPVVTVFEKISFCQASPVYDGEKWLMVRDPRITVSKDAHCTNPTFGAGSAAKKWLYAVGECGLAMGGGVPIIQEQYKAFLRAGAAGLRDTAVVGETGMAMLARGLHRGERPVSEAARVSFWLAFDISPTQQRELERKFADCEVNVPHTHRVSVVDQVGWIPL